MKRILQLMFAALALLLTCSASATPNTPTLSDLQREGRLQLKAWIEPQHAVARQQLNLQIEIATDRWFARGTEIGHIEVNDAIVMRRESFAVNATRRIDGETWSVQRWQIAIYPQHAGRYQIPAITVKLSIAGEPGGSAIEGQLQTTPFTIDVAQPPGMAADAAWPATPQMTVEEQFDKPLDQLKPGDAVIRTIRITAADLPAMMLPALHAAAPDGLAAYPKTPQLTDRSHRGDYRAERLEQITYVAVNGGDFTLPARQYHWWNINTRQLETIELPAHTIHVTGSAPPRWQTKTLIIGALLLPLIAAAWRYVARRRTAQPAQMSEKVILRAFQRACASGATDQAIHHFYRWLDHYSDPPSREARAYLARFPQPTLHDSFAAILAQHYAKQPTASYDLHQFYTIWREALQQHTRQTTHPPRTLNPRLNNEL